MLSSVEDGLGALLDHFREEGFYGLPVQFDFETRQAILDLRVGVRSWEEYYLFSNNFLLSDRMILTS